MSKSESATEMTPAMDMSPLALEEAMDMTKHGDKKVDRMFMHVKVGQTMLWCTSHICRSFGILVLLVDDYDVDEWSMTTVVIYRDGTITQHEVWSSGA